MCKREQCEQCEQCEELKNTPLTCPLGHSDQDGSVIYVLTSAGTWWPLCVACMSTPVPADTARWSPPAETSA